MGTAEELPKRWTRAQLQQGTEGVHFVKAWAPRSPLLLGFRQ